MILRSIQGDDEINKIVMGAMEVTIGALVKEGLLSEKQGNNFLEGHLAFMAPADGGFISWFKRVLPGFKDSKIMVVRV